MIEPERIKYLNNIQNPAAGKFVLYWMQADQREEFNHALEYAVETANRLKLPVAVVFFLYDGYPNANFRHFHFMLHGLKEVYTALKKRGIQMSVSACRPDEGIINAGKKAAFVVTDAGYTRMQKMWRKNAAMALKCSLAQVECGCVVPVETVSIKEEYTAATIRRKILSRIIGFIKPLKKVSPKYGSVKLKSQDISNPDKILSGIQTDRSVGFVDWLSPGTKAAKKTLKEFILSKLKKYPSDRSEPSLACESNMSPYIHFGQISPLYITLEMLKAGEKINGPFLEELIIRRELALNFVNYNKRYDSFECLPLWAKKTLRDHENDPRAYIYSLKDLETGRTHDIYWNAAQLQMVKTGKMHNYMRMYWGKKVMEWSKSCMVAYETLIYLNDKYELDGRDPNGYAGIAWCFGKHDRAWTEREIFGKVRYMNAAGLERKFYMNDYVTKLKNLK